MNEFRREDRYVVLKRSDLQKHAAVADLYALDRILEIVGIGRASEGKPPLQAVVIESDWPEYEVAWKLIEVRAAGPTVDQGAGTHRCEMCGAIAVPDDVVGCTRCGWDEMVPIDKSSLQAAVAEVLAEIRRAAAKFPDWPTDPLHAAAVVGEEAGELTKAVLQAVYEPHKGTGAAEVRGEAIQTAAMAIRFIVSMPKYIGQKGGQHAQELA